MQYELYSIYDRVAGTYGAPSLETNEGVFKRKIKDLLRNDERFYANAGDYDLYLVGKFDVFKGTFVDCEPTFVGRMEDLKEHV